MTTSAASYPAPIVPEERVLAVIKRHELGLLGTAIRVFLVAAVLGVIWAFIARFVPAKSVWADIAAWSFWAVCALAALWILMGRFRSWATAQLTITNHRVRIRYRSRKQGWEIPMSTILEVRVEVGPLQRVFKTGTLVVQTNFAPGAAKMRDVGRVASVQAEILALRNDCWARYPWSAPAVGHDWTMRAAS